MPDMTNSSSETLILSPKEALGILNLRSLGYYKIQQGVLQQNLSRFYKFESAEKVCDQFNNLINTLKGEEKLETAEKHPWLDQMYERKYMSDRQILDIGDTFSVLSNSKCEVLSVFDLKDAFHSLRLLEDLKRYCSILPYFRSASYIYQRMPIGLNISPSIWQSYINAILECLQSRKHGKAIMDDLLLFTPSERVHMKKLEDLLKALLKNSFKISLLKTELQYMGNTVFIKDRKVCIKPLQCRLEAIQRLQPPTTPKGCRSFTGMVNFLIMFCPKLQKLLKPIYDLSRKGRQFIWGKEQQEAFEEIKHRLIKAPVLHMPNHEGKFYFYSDMSKFATGSTLYQVQNGKQRLIDYASKRLQEAVKSYSITELELCGLAINIASFSHLLKRVHLMQW